MAYESITGYLTGVESGADLSAHQYKCVKLDAAGRVVRCNALGEVSMGVLQDNPDGAGQATSVAVSGQTKVRTISPTVTPGASLTTSALGLAVETATSGHVAFGRALEATSGTYEAHLLGRITANTFNLSGAPTPTLLIRTDPSAAFTTISVVGAVPTSTTMAEIVADITAAAVPGLTATGVGASPPALALRLVSSTGYIELSKDGTANQVLGFLGSENEANGGGYTIATLDQHVVA